MCTDALCPSWPPQGKAWAPSSSPPHVGSTLLAWGSSVLVVLPRSWQPAPEELLTQCLSHRGIRATSWDMEKQLWQLPWHQTRERKGKSRVSAGKHPAGAGEPLPSQSDTNPIKGLRGILLRQRAPYTAPWCSPRPARCPFEGGCCRTEPLVVTGGTWWAERSVLSRSPLSGQ